MDTYNESNYRFNINLLSDTSSSTTTSDSTPCRYQGIDGALITGQSSTASENFDLKQSIIRDVVGQNQITPSLVGFQIPLPELEDTTVDSSPVYAIQEAAFLKYGKFNLAARYLTTDNTYKYGVLQTDKSQTYAQLNLPRMVDLVRENQDKIKKTLDDILLTYNRDMNSLIIKRAMIAYIYEYISVSSMSFLQASGGGTNQMCLLSQKSQLQTSSSWRMDYDNDFLASLIASDSASESGDSSSYGVEFNDAMSSWDIRETLMDQAFQLAQSSYMKYLKYKINELILVYKASLLVQDMSNGPIMKSTFPVT